jgi:hypothetical protein
MKVSQLTNLPRRSIGHKDNSYYYSSHRHCLDRQYNKILHQRLNQLLLPFSSNNMPYYYSSQ